ncbi:MAG TPA: 30S ribosomal protein S4, partial [bacterium]|nr:30S ribosomal protein S4 [bacterium]
MAKYKEAKCKICRREGVKLYLKGERCHTEKCSFERKPYGPGNHGKDKKRVITRTIRFPFKGTLWSG